MFKCFPMEGRWIRLMQWETIRKSRKSAVMEARKKSTDLRFTISPVLISAAAAFTRVGVSKFTLPSWFF